MAGLKAMYFWWVQQSCLIFSTATAARIKERVIWLYSLKMHPLFWIVWIICLKEEAIQSFVLLFLGVIWLWVWECSHSYLPELPLCCGWTLLINRRITRWNNILSKLKTSPKRYGHLKTKHWHLLYECFREKNWKCLWKIRHLKKHICVWQKADTGSWWAHYIRWLSLWMGGTTLLTRFTMSMSTEQK